MFPYPTYRYKRQCGASLIEFAFVLPLLLMILIGTIYFGYVYVLQTAVTHAAQQAATAATGVNPVGNNGYEARVCSVITDTVTESLDWLPPSIGSASTTAEGQVACGSGGGSDSSDGESATSCVDAIEVLVNLPLAGSSALLPQINLPPFGKVPPVGLSNVTGLACVTL